MREPVSSPFTSFLAQHFDQINDYLATFFDGQATSADIERYLYAPLSAFTANAGKRHRPLICMLAATAVGGSFESARSAAAAIEHFQSGALIHDDIADNGQLRRSKPCMHLTEGTGLAINCGDLALTMVTKTVLDDPTLEADVKLRVLHELTEMIVRTIEGQALDFGWAATSALTSRSTIIWTWRRTRPRTTAEPRHLPPEPLSAAAARSRLRHCAPLACTRALPSRSKMICST